MEPVWSMDVAGAGPDVGGRWDVKPIAGVRAVPGT